MSKHIFWIASFPKSGNTLVRAILASLFFSQDGKFTDLKVGLYVGGTEIFGAPAPEGTSDLIDFGLNYDGTEDVVAAKTKTAFFPIKGTKIELIHHPMLRCI